MLISDEKKLKEISRREMKYVARYFSVVKQVKYLRDYMEVIDK